MGEDNNKTQLQTQSSIFKHCRIATSKYEVNWPGWEKSLASSA